MPSVSAMRSWVNLCARRSSRSDISSAMSWAARRAIFLRRAGLMALIFWFKVFIGSLADAYVVPSKPTRPILRSPAGVSDGPDGHYGFLFRIDDSKRESPEQKSPGVVLADRPAIRGFTDCVDGSIQFFDEVRSRLGAALPIPGDCAPNICDCALVVLNTLSAHSPWPRVRDAVVPKGRSRPCPFSDLRFCERLPHPKPLARIHS